MSTFLIVSMIWILSEIILGRLTKVSPENKQDKSSLKIIWTTIIVSVSIGIWLSTKNIGSINVYPFKIHLFGIILIICGLILRWASIFSLRKFFTVQVTIKQDHELIKSGLYKYVRHPAYLGSLLSFLGLGFALVNWISLLIIFLPVLFAFINRISVEEKVLINNFGEQYQDYIKDTKKLVPGLY